MCVVSQAARVGSALQLSGRVRGSTALPFPVAAPHVPGP